jgi:hypothetical protein
LEEEMREHERSGIVEMTLQLLDRLSELGVRDQALRHDAGTEVADELKEDRTATVTEVEDVKKKKYLNFKETKHKQ